MRHAVGNEDEVFRAIVVLKKTIPNPEWSESELLRAKDAGMPYLVPRTVYSETETVERTAGPYGTVGQARSIATRLSKHGRFGTRQDFVSKRVEVAEKIVWKEVPEK